MALADGGGGGSAAAKKIAKELVAAASEAKHDSLIAASNTANKGGVWDDTMSQARPADAVSKASPGEYYGQDQFNYNPTADISGGRIKDEYVLGPWDPADINIFGLKGDTSGTRVKEPAKTKDDPRPGVTRYRAPADAAQSSDPKAAVEARVNREAAKTPRSRDGSKLPVQGEVKSSTAPSTAVDDDLRERLSRQFDGTDRDNPFTGQAIEVGQGKLELSDKSSSDLTGSESRDMTTRLAEEAKDKGITGRGVQAYLEQRQGRAGTEGYQREETARLDKADVDEEMGRSEERATRAGMNRGGKDRGTETMTAEDYAALTPKQKAAVDLNTMLVEAVKRDMGVTREEGKKYDDRVQAVFGEDASTTQPFAPNTMNLLESIGYKGDTTKVNDFLKLKAAFDADDVGDLKLRKGEAPDANLMSAGFSRDAVQASLVESLTGARTDKDLRGGALDTQRDLLGTNEKLGYGEANPEGDRTGQLNAYFQQAFETMSTKGSGVKPEAIMDEARARMDDAEWGAFIEFLDVKSRESKQFDLPLGTNPDTDYKPTQKFRAQLQLNK